jgi:hypothetical protein
MPFDFVNNPTVGQVIPGPSGAGYRWDGVKWVLEAASNVGPFLPLSGGTVTGMLALTGARTWSGAFPGNNPALYESVTYTGSPASGFPGPEGTTFPVNLIALSESMTVPAGAGAYGISALEVQHNTTGGGGSRSAIMVSQQIHGTVANASNNSFSGMQITQQMGANVSGAAAGAGNGLGDAFGLGIMTQVMSGVYAHGVTGLEIDINPRSGSSVDYLVGMQIINMGVLGASGSTTANRFDCMLLLASADPTYKQATFGYYFGNPQSGDGKGFPITPTGTMIGSVVGSCANGIDFSQVSITGALLAGPSGFRIDGTGMVHTSALQTTSSNLLAVTSSGGNPIVNFGGNGPNYFGFTGGASGQDCTIQIAGEASSNLMFKTGSGHGYFGFVDNNNVFSFGIVPAANAANWINVYGSSSGQPVVIQVSPGAVDANVGVNINAKGTGSVKIGSKFNLSSIPTSATGLVAGDVWRNGTALNIV